MKNISELTDNINRVTQQPEYADRMLHDVPNTITVYRDEFIVDLCRGKRVMHLGCASGTLDTAIREVATSVVGVDREDPCDIKVDLDNCTGTLCEGAYDLVVLADTLEHLANPGNLLREIRAANCPVLISVPNAFGDVGAIHMEKFKENVNLGHYAYYSYWTLRQLVEKYGFTLEKYLGYRYNPVDNGTAARFAEGLIFVVR